MPVLFETGNVRVTTPASFGSDIVAVTFSERAGDSQNLDRPGFGQDFIRKLSLDGVFVTCAANDWYQYAEMPDLIAAVRRHLLGRTVVTYGSSMGGYAAIRFAQGLGAVRAIAISPQYTIDQRRMPNEARWGADSRRLRFIDDDIGRDITAETDVYVLFDPLDMDCAHAQKLAEIIPHVRFLTAPFASHPVGHFLREAGILQDIASRLLLGTHDHAHWCAMRRRNRSKSPIYWRSIAHHARRTDRLRLAHYAESAAARASRPGA